MTDTSVNLPVISTTSGQQLDGESLVIGGVTVIRERNRVSGANATDVAPVSSSGGLSVNQGISPWVVVASSTGGSQPVSIQNALPFSVVASTTGGNAPVIIQNALPLSVVASSTGGSVPVSIQNTLPLSVVASTTGGAIPVATHSVTQGTSPWLTQAATSGGAQPVAQSSTPWLFVASTTGGAIAVSTITSITSATVFQGAAPWQVQSNSANISTEATVLRAVSDDVAGTLTALNALNAAAQVALTGRQGASFQIDAGTLTATITAEQSYDNGTNWAAVTMAPAGLPPASTISLTNPNAATGGAILALPGATHARIRVSSFTSGTANGTCRATMVVIGAVQSGMGGDAGTAPPATTQVGGLLGTALRTVRMATSVPSSSDIGIIVREAGASVVRATQPTALADGVVSQITTDTKGRQLVTPYQARQLTTNKFLQVTATGETVLLASASGTYSDLIYLCINAATSNAVNSLCTIKDSSGGNTQFILNIGSGGVVDYVPSVLSFPVPWKHTTATSTGNAWTVNFGTGNVYNINAIFSSWTS